MKKRIDFIFDESDNSRKLLRFYPEQSHVHGFDDNCPQSWDEVYKVYYAWSVIHQFRDDKNSKWKAHTVFEMSCDENSVLGDIPLETKSLKIGEETSFRPMGYGADWVIKYHKGSRYFKPYYNFTVWKRATNQGYRFDLSPKDTTRFIEYIEFVQEYMLAHSEPI